MWVRNLNYFREQYTCCPYVKEYHNDKIDSQGWALYLKGDDFFVESIKVGKWIYYNDDGIIKEIIDYSKGYAY